MHTLTASEARKTFFELIKQTNSQHITFQIQHKSGDVIIMSAQEYENLQETLFLLSDTEFKHNFIKSVTEADKNETVSFEDVFGEPQ